MLVMDTHKGDLKFLVDSQTPKHVLMIQSFMMTALSKTFIEFVNF